MGAENMVDGTGKTDCGSSGSPFKKPSKPIAPTMGQKHQASTVPASSTYFCKFINKVLATSGLSKTQVKYISQHSWRQATKHTNGYAAQRWVRYAKSQNVNVLDFSFQNIMNFLEDMNSNSVAYSTIAMGKQFVSLCRTIKGQPFSKQEKFILEKFITGVLNTNPPTKCKMQEIWDVNSLLNYLVKFHIMPIFQSTS